MELRVTWWRRYGQNRLFVEEDGERLGWHDLWTGETVIEAPERSAEVYEAVENYFEERIPQVARPREVAVSETLSPGLPAPRPMYPVANQAEGIA